MPIYFFVIRGIIFFKNYILKKKYRAELVNNVILIYITNPEVVIHDYSLYVCQLLKKSISNIEKKCIVLYQCDSLLFLKILLPIVQIALQIEHTLVKPSGRDSQGAPLGKLKILNNDNNYLVRIVNYSILSKSDLIIDYSRINLHNIRTSNQFKTYIDKAFCISPTLYKPNISMHGREGVITLFGNPEESRRKDFLATLKNHQINSSNTSGVYINVDAIYRKVKIVINIRQTDTHDTLEELRVLPALLCGAIVICEAAPFLEKTRYSQFLICGTLAELPNIIIDVEKNYHEYHARIFGCAETTSPFLRRMKQIERCNKLSLMRVAQKINGDL
jgi:hypothetical protein